MLVALKVMVLSRIARFCDYYLLVIERGSGFVVEHIGGEPLTIV